MDLPRKGGYSRIREGQSLPLRISRWHQHPPIGCQPWSPECPTQVKPQPYVHAGLSRTPRTPQLKSPQVRSGSSEMAHPSPRTHQIAPLLRTFGLSPTHFQYMKISISNKLWLYDLTNINNTFYRQLQNMSVSFKNALQTAWLPCVTSGGRHR